jgi:hypothetical protein
LNPCFSWLSQTPSPSCLLPASVHLSCMFDLRTFVDPSRLYIDSPRFHFSNRLAWYTLPLCHVASPTFSSAPLIRYGFKLRSSRPDVYLLSPLLGAFVVYTPMYRRAKTTPYRHSSFDLLRCDKVQVSDILHPTYLSELSLTL